MNLNKFKNKWLSVDVEYNTSDYGLYCIGLYDGKMYECVTKHRDDLKDLLSNCWIIGHNFKSDWHVLKKWGYTIPIDRIVYDTKTLAYNFDVREEKLGLKALSKKYLGRERQTFKELFGKKDLKEFNFEEVREYNKQDCVDTWDLWKYYLEHSTEDQMKYFKEIEMPITRMLLEMEDQGILLDREFVKEATKMFESDIQSMKEDLQREAGPIRVTRKVKGKEQTVTIDSFNPNSPVQKVAAMNKLGIKVEGSDKRKHLDAVKDHRFVRQLQEYNEVKDCYQKGLKHFEKWVGSDGRIHPQFNQNTITGRLSSKDPNMQNQKARGDLGKIVRKCFIAKPGHVFIGADYAQIDSRVLASYSQEPVWVKVFNDPKGDLHQATADAAHEKAGVKISRQAGKTINHALGYGAGPGPVAYELGVDIGVAKKFLGAVKRALKTLEAWKTAVYLSANKMGGVSTLLGRFVKLPEIYNKDYKVRGHAERQAISILGQGGTAEIIKLAMLKLRKRGYIPLIQEHDSLLFEVPEFLAEQDAKDIKAGMEYAYLLNGVPLKVDVKIGKNWAEVK